MSHPAKEKKAINVKGIKRLVKGYAMTKQRAWFQAQVSDLHLCLQSIVS